MYLCVCVFVCFISFGFFIVLSFLRYIFFCFLFQLLLFFVLSFFCAFCCCCGVLKEEVEGINLSLMSVASLTKVSPF